ncbi:dual specificity protein phosphatase 1-like [Aplysia californica]|uniref:Dual specificity protein phosphatase 1-like n=1 Tax=Aplysia californica TaxID=6500 RepID=A0ABM1A816_APLCA|nr:dual specificity protein phosphatase 1-like [Aplysia californica]
MASCPANTVSPHVNFLTSQELRKLLDESVCSTQVVDCRSCLNYSTERISGAVNVFCPPLVRRRFQACLPLDSMLSSEAKVTLCRPSVSLVVVHEQEATDPALFARGQSYLSLILTSLQHFLGERNYAILIDGYRGFRKSCPELCSSHSASSGQLRHISRSGPYSPYPRALTCPDLRRTEHSLPAVTETGGDTMNLARTASEMKKGTRFKAGRDRRFHERWPIVSMMLRSGGSKKREQEGIKGRGNASQVL